MISFIIKYWVQILLSLIVTLITHLYHSIYKYIKKIDSLEKQSCLNIKMHIVEKYEKITQKGYMSMDEKEEILELYNIYKKLECSNVVEGLVQGLDSIPIK